MLLVQFDEHDRVHRFDRAVWPSRKSYGDFLEEWIAGTDREPSGHSNQGIEAR